MSEFSPILRGYKCWNETLKSINKYPQMSKGMTRAAGCPENSFEKALAQALSKAGDSSSTSPFPQQLLADALGLYEDASHQPVKSRQRAIKHTQGKKHVGPAS